MGTLGLTFYFVLLEQTRIICQQRNEYVNKVLVLVNEEREWQWSNES